MREVTGGSELIKKNFTKDKRNKQYLEIMSSINKSKQVTCKTQEEFMCCAKYRQ